MKRILVLCFIALFAVSTLGFSVDDLKYPLGGKVSDLILTDLDGKEFDLDKVLADENVQGVVFVFLSYKCPASVASDSRYIKYAGELKKEGILFVGLNANMATENAEGMKAYAEKLKYNFPVLWDEGNVIADRFDAERTPHVFFVDNKSILRYKGSIDDNTDDPAEVKITYLADVIDEYLTGKELSVTETKPDG